VRTGHEWQLGRYVTEFEIIAVIVIMIFGALVQASIGFGMSLSAGPLLILINPLFVPAPLLVAALFLTMLVAYRDRSGIRSSGVGSLMAGRVIGTIPGALLIASLPLEQIRLVLGGLILVAVVMSAGGFRLSQRTGTIFGVGIVSGFMSSTVAIGGPPIALAYQHADGKQLRGTLAFIFTMGTVISLTGLFLVGRFRITEFQMALALLPGTLIGFMLSGRVAAFLDRGYTRVAVLIMATSAAIGIIVTALT
jgi:uncharacterized membrane protein YfcA